MNLIFALESRLGGLHGYQSFGSRSEGLDLTVNRFLEITLVVLPGDLFQLVTRVSFGLRIDWKVEDQLVHRSIWH